ncbi:unnamed protein product, partial [Laminaria digitata]
SSSGSANFGDDDWLASLSSGHGHRVLARYHDRVWYEATTVEGSAGAAGEEGSLLAVRFKGFEDDGSVTLPADHSHLAPIEEGADGAACSSRGGGGGGSEGLGGSPGSDGGESEIEDAWADAAPPTPKDGDGETGGFFKERVLGERGRGGGGGGGPSARARGAGGTAAAAPCSDAYIVGDWEQHTKGFGSRMMSRMGYRRGEGLGKEKQGIARPVPIRVLPERRALDHLRVDDGPGPRKTSSGNNRNQKKSKPGFSSSSPNDGGGEPQKAMFDFVNVTIHASVKGKAPDAGRSRPASGLPGRSAHRAGRRPIFDGAPSSCMSSSSVSSGSTPGGGGGGGGVAGSGDGAGVTAGAGAGAGASGKRAGDMSRSELRSHVVGAREAELALATKVERLKETIERNSERDPRTAAQARRKLEEVHAQAKEIRASRDRAERVLGNKGDKGKGGGKGGLFSF